MIINYRNEIYSFILKRYILLIALIIFSQLIFQNIYHNENTILPFVFIIYVIGVTSYFLYMIHYIAFKTYINKENYEYIESHIKNFTNLVGVFIIIYYIGMALYLFSL